MNTVFKSLPTLLTLSGHEERGSIEMLPAGKPPKLRYKPGNIVRIGAQHYEIIYAYRVEKTPHEWLYCCELRDNLMAPESDLALEAVYALGGGQSTPRVVIEIFRSSYDVFKFFADIPTKTDRCVKKNQELIRAIVVSSGEILLPKSSDLTI